MLEKSKDEEVVTDIKVSEKLIDFANNKALNKWLATFCEDDYLEVVKVFNKHGISTVIFLEAIRELTERGVMNDD